MKTCATCKWQPSPAEVHGHTWRSPDGGWCREYGKGREAWLCGCSKVALPLVRTDPVTGEEWYGIEATQLLDPRPRCVDVNPKGECPWWEEGGPSAPAWAPLHSDNPARDWRPGGVSDPESQPPRRNWLQRALGIG